MKLLSIIKNKLRYVWYRIQYDDEIHAIAYSTNRGKFYAYNTIIKNRKIYTVLYGRNFIRECLLNYMIHFKPNKDRIMQYYIKYIYSKNKLYTSDIVITLNILNKFTDLSEQEKDFLYATLSKEFGNFKSRAMLIYQATKFTEKI